MITLSVLFLAAITSLFLAETLLKNFSGTF